MNEKAMELLKIFDLDGEAGQPASSLPYGKQRKLEIARALATNPKLLLLDEPAAGMNPNETAELMETIRFVRDKFDMAVLLIEHDMSFVMGLCEHIYGAGLRPYHRGGRPRAPSAATRRSLRHIWEVRSRWVKCFRSRTWMYITAPSTRMKGISFDVNEGEIVTLIGANGAGKTTTLHAVSRLLKPKQRARLPFAASPSAACEAHKIIQPGPDAGAGGAARVFAADGAAESGAGGVHPKGRQRMPLRRIMRWCFSACRV